MLGRLLFSSYSRLLAGISLAAVAIALTGCNDQVAQKPVESRPVLV
ncbi:MAG: efflux RND transporter periplasmic adaptor subunit, partial [Bradyrhizobium sp.]